MKSIAVASARFENASVVATQCEVNKFPNGGRQFRLELRDISTGNWQRCGGGAHHTIGKRKYKRIISNQAGHTFAVLQFSRFATFYQVLCCAQSVVEEYYLIRSLMALEGNEVS